MAYKSFGNYYFYKGAQELLEMVDVYDITPELICESTKQALVRGRYSDANGLLSEIRGLLNMLGLGRSTPKAGGGSAYDYQPRDGKGNVNDPGKADSWKGRAGYTPSGEDEEERDSQTQYGNVSNIAGIDKLAAQKRHTSELGRKRAEDEADAENKKRGGAARDEFLRNEKGHGQALERIKMGLSQVNKDITMALNNQELAPAAKDVFLKFVNIFGSFMKDTESKLAFQKDAWHKAPQLVKPQYPATPNFTMKTDPEGKSYDQRLRDRKAAGGPRKPKLYDAGGDGDDEGPGGGAAALPFPGARRRGA
jgi:hypothetical protein